MVQVPLFATTDRDSAPSVADGVVGVVNVAQVPKRSPFRYPGGKTWAIPAIRRWLAHMPVAPAMLVEPFAGGGIVSLTVAFERLAGQVTMVELDADVAAVWQTIIDGDAEWLAQRIFEFDLTHENVLATLRASSVGIQEQAFQTILRNRVQRGGIMARGAGLVKNGENGRGLKSRWYPITLGRRIRDIAAVRGRLRFVHGDGLRVMRQYAAQPDVVYFTDPPYTASAKRAGSRLYTCAELDHEELFHVAGTCAGEFLMTYDDAPELRELARTHGFDTHLIRMKSTHHAVMTELLIGRCLDWARAI